MKELCEIIAVEKPDDAVWDVVGWGLHKYNVQHAGEPEGKDIYLVLYTPEHEVAGGLVGKLHWGWLCVDLLFVKEEFRGCGYGHRLLEMAENEARQHGAKSAYLDTFTYQAPDFYLRHGYRVFGELKGFPAGHDRLYFMKEL